MLSPPQCHAAFCTMPHTLASVDQSLFAVLGSYSSQRRGRLGLVFGRVIIIIIIIIIIIEVRRMWNMKCFVIPVIIGATGIVSKSLQKYLETTRGQHSIDSLQKLPY
jgi:hypothetical protein